MAKIRFRKSIPLGGGFSIDLRSVGKKKRTKKKIDSKYAPTPEESWGIVAVLCKFLFIPMIILGVLLSLVEPIVGIIAIAIGIIEFLYYKKHSKNNLPRKEQQ